MFTAGFAEIGRTAGDAGSASSRSAWRRHQAVAAELPRPLQHARRPYPDLQLVPRGGSDCRPVARHGDAIGRVGTHLLALTARRGIQVGVWLSTGNEADVSVADGISFLADDPDTTAIAAMSSRSRMARNSLQRSRVPVPRQAGHRDEGRRLGDRRRGGGLAHRFPRRQRRGPMTRHWRQLGVERARPRRIWSRSPMPAPAVGCALAAPAS